MQTGQFTAAKRGPNYNRITDKYPPRQASGGRGGASLPVQGVARGQAGLRVSAPLGRRSLLRPCPQLPASCARSLKADPWKSFLCGLQCKKPCLFGGFSPISGSLLFGCFSALRIKAFQRPAQKPQCLSLTLREKPPNPSLMVKAPHVLAWSISRS